MITCVLTRILFIESLRERYNETTTAPIVPIAESASQIFPKSTITFNFILPFSFCTLNHHLEEMATSIFENMFPNVSSGKSTIGNYIIPKRGKNLLSKDAIVGKVPVVAGGLQPSTFHNIANTKSPVLTISASGANAGYVNLWHIPVWSSDSSYIDISITDNVYFWYVMLKKRQQEIYDSQTGSAQPHIYPKHIEIMPTIDLSEDKVSRFTKQVTPLFESIGNNIKEIGELQTLRDTLLPKLLSGEISVNQASK